MNSKTISIRIAAKRDWHDIIDIYNQAVDERKCTADVDHITIDSRIEWLETHLDRRYPLFVGEVEGVVRGWCSLSPYRPGRRALRTVAEISYYVAKGFRGIRIGSAMVGYALREAKRLGFTSIIAILLEVNTPSISLLKNNGFDVWGLLPQVVDVDGIRCGQYILGKQIGAFESDESERPEKEKGLGFTEKTQRG